MRYTIFVLLLLPVFSFGQEAQNPEWQVPYGEFSPPDTANHNNNVIYLSGSGAPFMIGARYDRYFGRVGAYGAWVTGEYPGGDNITNRQMRYSLGAIYRLDYIRDQIDSPIISLALVYHDWQGRNFIDGQLNPERAFRKWSFETGVGGRIKRFNVAGRADFMQMEICVDAGFNF